MPLKKAPKANIGDSIALEPLIGKAIAVRIDERKEVETKFGNRSMSYVTLLVHGSGEPLRGVLFQTYFQSLPAREWFAGIVRKDRMRWLLDSDALSAKQIKDLEALIAKLPSDEDVPF